MNELSKEKIMTIKEVAEILKCSVDLIQKKCKDYFPEIIQNGKTTFLNEKQVTIIKIDIEKNPYLRQSSEVKTDMQMTLQLVEAAKYFENKYIEIKKENEIMKPKAIVYDDFIEINDLHNMSDVAKIIDCGMGRNKLFEFLRNSKVLKSDNTPYQSQVDAGYFKIKISVNTDIEKNIPVTFVTPKGIEYIKKLIKQYKSIVKVI